MIDRIYKIDRTDMNIEGRVIAIGADGRGISADGEEEI